MILQLVVLLTGAFGAFLFRLKQTPAPRVAVLENPGTWLEVCLAGASSVVTWALLPADWQAWLSNPLLAGCAAFVINGGGVNLASNVLQKLPAALRGNGKTGTGSSGSVRLALLVALGLAAIAAAAAACSYLPGGTKPPVLTVNLTAADLLRVGRIYGRLEVRLGDGCTLKALSDATCKDLSTTSDELARVLDQAEKAPDQVTPAQVQRGFDLLLQLAGGLAASPVGGAALKALLLAPK